MSLSRRTVRRAARTLPLALALFLLFALVQGAAAAPPEPTMSLAQLRTALESGTMDGYLLTTMKGSVPEEIPVTVQSIVDSATSSLILFEATGPKIAEIGGVASGMSGSPVYVDDGGTVKLVGALSYGDSFTLGGMALATPIEYMAAIETDYPVGAVALLAPQPPQPGTYELAAPVRAGAGVVRSVVLARSVSAAARLEAASGQTVMAPLGVFEIGGVRPGSAAYERIVQELAPTGMLVRPAAFGAGGGGATPALTAGSPCAVLYADGAAWVGAAGTVTYVDGATVLLFGHPLEQSGAISATLTGGDVQGVWQSSFSPYKMIAPRDVKGTCVQDRLWGVEAFIGQQPGTYPVATSMTVPGSATPVTADTDVAEWLFTGDAYPTLPADLASGAAWEALGQYAYPGSARTTTVVTVSDSTGTYRVERADLWTDAFDVTGAVGSDAATILTALAANPDGVLQPSVDGVTVDATFSATQRSARVVGITLPGGMHEGATTVRSSYYAWGSSALQTIDGTLTVPAGTSLNGRMTVSPAVQSSGGVPVIGPGATGAPLTLAETVAGLNALPKKTDLLIKYSPFDMPVGGATAAASELTAVVPTGCVFSGEYAASSATVDLVVEPATVAYGARGVTAAGAVPSTSDVAVSIYRQDAGAPAPVLVDTVTAVAQGGVASFSAIVPSLKRNTVVTAQTGAVPGALPGSASAFVEVSARVWLTGSGRLTVHVKPGDASGLAQLQRKKGDRWVAFKTVTVKHGRGRAKLPKGTYVLRAQFQGSDVCGAGTSRATTVRVR
jgi:hypothetical protein